MRENNTYQRSNTAISWRGASVLWWPAAAFLGTMAQVPEEVRSDHGLARADMWLAWAEQEDLSSDD
jgi:hypothetical protein